MRTSRKAFCLGLLGAALILRFFVYWEGGRHIPVTTDEAITVLQAKRILEGKPQYLMFAQPYMIPFEAYAMVPLLWLPRTAHGMRVLITLESLTLLALMLWMLRRNGGSFRAVSAGALLILFPSAYFIINTFGYSFPHNISAYLLSMLGLAGVCLLQSPDLPWKRRIGLLFATGFFCGMAFSNAMLSLTLVVPIALVAVVNGRFRWLVPNALLIGGGAALGLLPFLYTLRRFPGAHAAVSSSRSLADAWKVATSHLFRITLPRTLGVGSPVFPDEAVYALDPGRAVALFGALFLLGLIALLVWRVCVHLRSLWQRECPALGLADAALGVILLNLAAYASSTRSGAHDYRYLFPILLVLPFAFAEAQRRLPRVGRALLVAIASAYALFNVTTMLATLRAWAEPGFAERVVNTPDLEPALAVLRDNGIRHCYAQHWGAYRINFVTDEAILSSQPYNERFPTWTLPYKDEVDAAPRAAYVLTEVDRFLKPHIFAAHLEQMGISSRRVTAGAFEVFFDFEPPTILRGRRLLESSRIRAIDGGAYFPPTLLERWTDLDLHTRVHSLRLQEDGMSFIVELDAPAELSLLRYNIGFWREDHPAALHIDARIDGDWQRVLSDGVPTRDPFAFRNGRPIYGGDVRSLAFPPVQTDALRVVLSGPRRNRAWTFSFIELFETSPE